VQLDWTEGPLAEGLQLYRDGKFFEAHEAWETVWSFAEGPERSLLQALIQITAAFHHLNRKNNRIGASLLLEQALGRLLKLPDQFGGIEVNLLAEEIRERIRQFQQGLDVTPIVVQTVQDN